LSKRKKPQKPWQSIAAGRSWPLSWAIDHTQASSETRQLVARLGRWCESEKKSRTSKIVGLLEDWLASSDSRRSEPTIGLEILAWSYVLPDLAGTLPAAPWCEVLDYLTRAATDWPDLSLERDPVGHQWLAGELPLTLAYQFPELPECRELRDPAADALATGFRQLLDGNGLPTARYIDRVRPLLACWTRCRALARSEKRRLFDDESQMHYEWFVRRALQLTRETGTAVFSEIPYRSGDRHLFQAALKLVADEDDLAIADQILPERSVKGRRSQKKVLFPESAANSEWGHLAILRPSWLRGSPQLVVASEHGCMRTELNCGEETVWSGTWDHEIRIDGQTLDQPSAWEETCWSSDDDVDYQEFQADLSDGWVLQRQIMLAREDHFLLIADALLGPREANIEYRCGLPLAGGIDFRPAEETHEGFLVGRRRLGLAMPLAFAEWRTARAPGTLGIHEGRLQLSQTCQARRIYAPLFIDLRRKRFKRPLTWRQLTVAERLEVVPPGTAVAYRVQVGEEQWLFYRSLLEAANRTVLGENLSNEFLAARFGRDGDAEELIRIDSD
jgi:hypothetical protein